MKNKKLLISAILMILLSIWLVSAIVSVSYIKPIDEYYLLRGPTKTNISFQINSTPTGSSGVIKNATLWINVSGTWKANFTNTTDGTVGSVAVYEFTVGNNATPQSGTLTDGDVFVWNVQVYDNITVFYDETVAMSTEEFTILDNYTTGCSATDKNCIVLKAGRGRISNYPVLTLDNVQNDTGTNIVGYCELNGSVGGFFYCNQTRVTYNGSGNLLSTEIISSSNVIVNYTIISGYRFASANRTVYVEDTPAITLTAPADAAYKDSATVSINITVAGDDDTYQCNIYSNDTGNWSVELGTITATNNTAKVTSKVFTEGNVVWNARCAQSMNSNIFGWSASNYTVTTDTTNPVVDLAHPSDSGYKSTRTFYFNATSNDTNLASCNLYHNISVDATNWSSSSYNETITTISNTVRFNFSQKVFGSDHNVLWATRCNDSAGRSTWSSNYSVTIDTALPALKDISNYTSVTPNCKGFTEEFNFSEAVNLSFRYGLTTMSQTWEEIESDFAINQTVTLTFNDSYETTFYANITICDRASNCNGSSSTYSELTLVSPIGLCTGWTYWSIYDNKINMTDLYTASTADYVYWWNNTGQSWTSYSSASTEQGPYSLRIGDVVHFYESTNTTYFRNTSGSPVYIKNVTAGHVYFGLYDSFTLGNISHYLFKNDSGGNVTVNNSLYFGAGDAGGLEFQIRYLAGYNNTNQEYVSSIYTWSYDNETAVGVGPDNGLDTVWAYFEYNLTINFTTGGSIMGNWT